MSRNDLTGRVREAVGLTAVLRPGDQQDSRAPGGAITVELCGSWHHAGACRWPHHTGVDAQAERWTIRTLLAVEPAEREEVIARVRRALDQDPGWALLSFEETAITENERPHATRLATEH